MKIRLLKKLGFLTLTLLLSMSVSGQDKKKKKVPPKEGRPPVVRPAEKPPVRRPRSDKEPKPVDLTATGSVRARFRE